jgi:methyl-accepting chemotaxis protein
MDDLTQQNAALAEEASAASTNMSEQAQQMNMQMQFFNTQGATDEKK